MIPLGDDNSLRKIVPYVTYVLLCLNIIVFLAELMGGEEFIMKWSFIPARFTAHPIHDSMTILTSMFMHGGFGHIVSNMIYLWIFGDNVEDRFGHIPYLIFYLLCGILATLAQYLFTTYSSIPNLGASGAIAGVLGAYIFLFPKTKIKVLAGNILTAMPALLVIGFWFLLQFISGVGTLASTEDEGGVAYMAHIGGFVAGFLLTFLFRGKGDPR